MTGNGDGPLTVTVARAAELLGVSEWTYREALKRGEVPGRHIGRRIVVPVAQLEQFLAEPDTLLLGRAENGADTPGASTTNTPRVSHQ
jgi:excisionase family DNA binding protein